MRPQGVVSANPVDGQDEEALGATKPEGMRVELRNRPAVLCFTR